MVPAEVTLAIVASHPAQAGLAAHGWRATAGCSESSRRLGCLWDECSSHHVVRVLEEWLEISLRPLVMLIVVYWAPKKSEVLVKGHRKIVSAMGLQRELNGNEQPDPLRQRMRTHGNGNQHRETAHGKDLTGMRILRNLRKHMQGKTFTQCTHTILGENGIRTQTKGA